MKIQFFAIMAAVIATYGNAIELDVMKEEPTTLAESYNEADGVIGDTKMQWKRT